MVKGIKLRKLLEGELEWVVIFQDAREWEVEFHPTTR